jgi:putative solute:sodium symporter small subunit
MDESIKGPDEQSGVEPDLHRPEVHACLDRYWRTNVTITLVLLAVWAVVGLGCSILLADWLNGVRLPGTGFPLGFWFAQQGSIIVFVLLILVYCILINRLDAKHHRELQRLNHRE